MTETPHEVDDAPSAAAPARRHPARWLGWTVVTVVALDVLTKLWVRNQIAIHEAIAFFGGWVHVIHRTNEGVAFGLLDSTGGPWRTPLLLGLAVAGMALLGRLAVTSSDRETRLAATLMLGGAAGNFLDRLANGGVTDFLLVRYFPFVFNVADVAITLGAAFLTWAAFRPARRAEPTP